jgi:hypothetical protein
MRAARPLPAIEMTGILVEATLSRDGSTAARVEASKNRLTAIVWRTHTGRERTRFAVSGTPDLKCQLALSPDGNLLAVVLGSGSDVRYAGVVRLAAGTEVRALPAAERVLGLTYSPDGATLAVHRDGGVELLDGRTGRFQRAISLPGMRADRAAFSPDGRSLAVGSVDYPRTKLAVIDLATGKVREEREVKVPRLDSLAFTPGGGTLTAGHQDGKAVFWDVSRRFELRAGGATYDLVEQMMSHEIGPAFTALGMLIRSRDRAIPLLRARLKPSKGPPTEEEIAAWIALTRDDDKVLRTKATDALIGAGDVALPQLRLVMARGELRPGLDKVLDGIENPPGRRTLLILRGVEVLERIASAEARRFLTELAGGDPDATLTKEAKGALARLARR